MTKRSKFLFGLLLGFAVGIGGAAYVVWAALYDHIMTMSEVRHIDVEEVVGTHPLQLKVTVETVESAPVIRTVTTKRLGSPWPSSTILHFPGL